VRITSWARRRRADGATLRELASDTGICAESLRRWTTAQTTAPKLVPIEVVADWTDEQPRGLLLITAAGHRIEGLTIADTIVLVRGLG
jgi:hypothetical protein